MHLTELKQSDWVISALIINEFEKNKSAYCPSLSAQVEVTEKGISVLEDYQNIDRARNLRKSSQKSCEIGWFICYHRKSRSGEGFSILRRTKFLREFNLCGSAIFVFCGN